AVTSPGRNGFHDPSYVAETSPTPTAGASSPVTRVVTFTPTRLSTPRLVSSPADRVLSTEAATPAGWSPGSACCGTVIVSGTTTLSPASTVTSGAMSIQVPASVDFSS